jgi:hypothetical protein
LCQRRRKKFTMVVGCDLAGSSRLTLGCSGRAPLRSEREEPLQSEHSRETKPRAGGRHKERPSRGKASDVPLGYSGRIALRREQCDALAKSLKAGIFEAAYPIVSYTTL